MAATMTKNLAFLSLVFSGMSIAVRRAAYGWSNSSLSTMARSVNSRSQEPR